MLGDTATFQELTPIPKAPVLLWVSEDTALSTLCMVTTRTMQSAFQAVVGTPRHPLCGCRHCGCLRPHDGRVPGPGSPQRDKIEQKRSSSQELREACVSTGKKEGTAQLSPVDHRTGEGDSGRAAMALESRTSESQITCQLTSAKTTVQPCPYTGPEPNTRLLEQEEIRNGLLPLIVKG